MKNKLAETYDEPSVDKILAVNDKIISCTRIQNDHSQLKHYPLFVDGTGKNDYFPSLYTAIAYEPLIKVVDSMRALSHISSMGPILCVGSQKFLDLSNFQKDQVVGIRSSKGDPHAIGALDAA